MKGNTAKIFAVANQKGGVGKTTTSVNLSTAIAAADKKVLLIDLDPQGNATTGLGFAYNQREHDIYAMILGKSEAKDGIRQTEIPNLHLIPATVDLSAAEMEVANIRYWQFILKNLIKKVADQYDYIFIDCPPSLGLLTVNALSAADKVIIPLQCEFFALEGLGHLLKTVALVKQNLNPELEIEGVILTMYDRRNKLCEQVEADVRGYLKDLVYNTVIPRNIKLSEAPSYGKPAIVYDMKCPGARAYIYLAKEILERHEVKID